MSPSFSEIFGLDSSQYFTMQSLTLCCANQRGDKKIIYLQRLESDSALHMLTSVESDSSLANTALTNVCICKTNYTC